MLDVFFYEAFQEEAEAIKKFLPENVKADYTWKTIQEYGSNTPPAKVISIRTQSKIPSEWSQQLDAILSRSTGYDHLLAYQAETHAQLPMGYLPLYCHRAVAEQALLLMLSLARKLPMQMNQFNTFNRDGITGRELLNKKLLVVGVGNIGYQIVSIGKGLGMEVLPVDIEKKHSDLTYVDVKEGIKEADFIVCAMNLTTENVHYFDYELLKQSKKHVIFVNISRGELSNTVDLLRLLKENHIAGIGLDVYEEEKKLSAQLRDHQISDSEVVKSILELKQDERVVLTPHNAFNTEEGVMRKSEQSVQQILHFLEKGDFLWKAKG